MNKLKTILVEDEGAALRRLEKMANENPFIQVVATAKSGKDAIQHINQFLPDLVLLDIELKDFTAFEVLQQIHPNFKGQIIFITAFQQYAVEAFNIAATDYLLKPYDEARFTKAISRAVHYQQQTDIQKLLTALEDKPTVATKFAIQEGTKTWYFLPKDILWIEAEGYYSNIHKVDGTILVIRKTLKKLAQVLPIYFTRVNRSALINNQFVEQEANTLSKRYYILKGGIKIVHSKSYAKSRE